MSEDDTTYIYILAAVNGEMLEGPVKIGISADPWKRLNEIQTGNPRELQVATWFPLPTREIARHIEFGIHQVQRGRALRGEWFDMGVVQAIQIVCIAIRTALEAHGTEPETIALALEHSGVIEHERKVARHLLTAVQPGSEVLQ